MRTYTLIFFSFLQIIVHSQNLVPNPSFESFSSCPQSSGELELVVNDWFSFSITPDYFNICNNEMSGEVGVPNNFTGQQLASDGEGYVGLGAYSSILETSREYIACELLNPLNVGTEYSISFKVALNDGNAFPLSYCAGNSFGVKFFVNPNFSQNNPFTPDNSPDFQYSNFITDTLNWTEVSGSFIPTEAFNWLALGNFLENELTDTIHLSQNTSQSSCVIYLYLDDICVSEGDSCLLNMSSNLDSHNSFIPQIGPNPFMDKISVTIPTNDKYNVTINYTSGHTVYTNDGIENKLNINTVNWAAGIYLITISTKTNIYNTKIIKP